MVYFGLLVPLKTAKRQGNEVCLVYMLDRRSKSIWDLKRCPLRNAVGLKNAAGSEEAMFWFSLWRQTDKIIIIQDVPPVLLPTAVLMSRD